MAARFLHLVFFPGLGGGGESFDGLKGFRSWALSKRKCDGYVVWLICFFFFVSENVDEEGKPAKR